MDFVCRTAPLALSAALLLAAAAPGPADAGTGPLVFNVKLTGEAEVTAEGVPDQGDLDGRGKVQIKLRSDGTTVCWKFSKVKKITLPAAAAHIHEAPSTTTGPIVVTLSAPNAKGKAKGCTTVDAEIVTDIAANPADYYVNVHTSDFPAGALRGQLP